MSMDTVVIERARNQVARVGSQRLQAVAVLGILGGMAGMVALRNPHVPGSLGICPSLLIFGVYCPGCGSLRAMFDLMHGDVLGSVGHNVLMIPALIFLVGWSILRLRSGNAERAGPVAAFPRPHPLLVKTQVYLVMALPFVIVVYAVVRNFPGSALAP
jgi:hypothetical protein